MESKGIDADERNRCIQRLEPLCQPSFLNIRIPSNLKTCRYQMKIRWIILPQVHTEKPRGNDELRAHEAESPLDTRARLRGSMAAGFHVSLGKKLRGLHRLGSCDAVPGVDYLRFAHLSLEMPQRRFHDSVCRR